MPIQTVKNCLQNWFDFPKNKVFCQVSTIDKNSPHIRTMDLYHITPQGHLVLLTETSTRKWRDLINCPRIAICVVNVEYGQIVIEGSVVLKTQANDSATTQFYWDQYLDQYWRDFYLSRVSSSSSAPDLIPSSFGVIMVCPLFFEIIEINRDDFLKSSRNQYQLEQDSWIMREVSPV